MIFLDTHIVVWLYAGLVSKLSAAAAKAIESNDVFISQMVKLELQYLFEIGRITTKPTDIVQALEQAIGLSVSNMNPAGVFETALSTSWTRDVFDRLITAEAISESVPLVTRDEVIRSNYVNAIWD